MAPSSHWICVAQHGLLLKHATRPWPWINSAVAWYLRPWRHLQQRPSMCGELADAAIKLGHTNTTSKYGQIRSTFDSKSRPDASERLSADCTRPHNRSLLSVAYRFFITKKLAHVVCKYPHESAWACYMKVICKTCVRLGKVPGYLSRYSHALTVR